MPPSATKRSHQPVDVEPDDTQPRFVKDEKPRGDWLCAEGPYQDYINKLCGANPALGLADPENSAIPLSRREVWVTLLRADESHRYHRIEDLDASRKPDGLTRQLRDSPAGAKNVWIVENINRDVVAILGEHFKMDPTFFLGYERSSKWRRYAHEPNMAPVLPTLTSSVDFFSLKYFDLRDFGPGIESYSVSCADTGRHLYRTKWNDFWISPSIVDRSCAVYRRKTEKGGWDIVLLCDPPLRHVHVWKPHPTPEESESQYQEVSIQWDRAFQGGYPDFLPLSDSLSVQTNGPPRDSLREDISYYLMNHANSLPTRSPPAGMDIPLFFVRKVIASHYMQIVNFTTSYLAQFEWPLLRRESLEEFTTTWAQARWSDIQGVSRRCTEYVADLESIFLSLNVPFGEPRIDPERDWGNMDLDFQFLLHRAKAIKIRANELNNAFTGLTGIVANAQANREAERALNEAKRSVREAKNMKTLTLIAMIFIPLAFTCGLFSMSDNYIPGGGSFWVFFAVSVPLVLLVFSGAFLGELGYDSDGEWVWKTFIDNLSVLVKRKRERIS
ncbi:hypothetical protein K458DRAFT_358788 [Lentithecium fluviatile CBS 122367]|uniref:Cora-domain-containing protein n=1 Tax=Lentithecium fluviatile CBS 122367 TaxID=1168545 RepID=A0A6G1JH25_9PLEO|nr:hypothetical protein K458DRAFT_358788 [Lentithecium fluviatile CBS 122367]